MADLLIPNQILIVDDDPTVATSLEPHLTKLNIQVHKAHTLDTALYIFNQKKIDVVLIELDFGPLPGLALMQKWRKHEFQEKRTVGIIGLASGQRTAGQDSLAKEMGEIEITTKPVNAIQLLSLLKKSFVGRKRAFEKETFVAKVVEPFIKQGKIDKAIAAVTDKADALGPHAHVLLLDLHEKAGNLDQALRYAQELLMKEPNNIGHINNVGRLLMRLGKFDEARTYLERADSVAPGNIERIADMATVYLELKEPDKSVAKFKELLDLTPENPEAKFDVFHKLYEAGFDKHAVDFGRSVSKPMEIVRHYNNKGVLYSKEGKVSEAVSQYERAIRFFPKFKENYRILYNIAIAKANERTPEGIEKAIDALKNCLELEPNFEKASKMLAQLESRTQAKKAS